jgi:hypothetical protein
LAIARAWRLGKRTWTGDIAIADVKPVTRKMPLRHVNYVAFYGCHHRSPL